MHCSEAKGISVEQLAEGLRGLGYELCPSELGVLMHQLAVSQQGQVGKPAFLASQLDWQNFQQNFKCATPALIHSWLLRKILARCQ